jgi:hypothetical protein
MASLSWNKLLVAEVNLKHPSYNHKVNDSSMECLLLWRTVEGDLTNLTTFKRSLHKPGNVVECTLYGLVMKTALSVTLPIMLYV